MWVKCNTIQYLDYLDCKCKKKIIDLFVEQCIEYDNDNKTKIVNKTVNKTDNKIKIVNKTVTKTDNKTKLIIITVTKNDNQTKIVNKTVKNSCKVYIILAIVSIVISTVYTIYFVYYSWFLFKIKIFSLNIILVKKL